MATRPPDLTNDPEQGGAKSFWSYLFLVCAIAQPFAVLGVVFVGLKAEKQDSCVSVIHQAIVPELATNNTTQGQGA